jgi:trk system potassium uptake protein TrkA
VHIVVMGCGRVGSSLARNLERAGHSVAIIDQNRAAFRRLGPEFAGDQITGVGFDRSTLRRAGIDRAGAFAAVSSGDNSNIIAARVARETFGVAHVVARIYDPKRAEVYERLGIPTVATVPWTVNRFLSVLLGDKHVEDWRDPSGAVSLLQVPLHEGWIGHKVKTLEAATEARVRPRHAADRRDHAAGRRPGAPAGHRRHRRCRRAGHRQRADHRGALMRVAIAGAGGVGRSIARELLEHRHNVMLIERDPDRVDPSRVPEAEWLQADAAELASLEEARLQDCDVVISATGDDKVNLVVSLLAKTEFAVRRVVARINHPDNEWLFTEAWGVDVAVSTPRVMVALVEEAVSVGDLVRLMTFRQGQANLVEITLPEGAPVVGQAVGDMRLPRDSALVAIVRGSRVVVPSPEEPLEDGDELLFVAVQEAEPELRQLVCGDGSC